MTKLSINLENCYGINNLKHVFEFTEDQKTFSIYAQNGSMKTSLAKTFENISRNEEAKDLIFPERKTKAEIKFDEKSISKEIFVINSYREGYESEKVSTLLVNKKLRDEFTEIHQDIDNQKQLLLGKLKSLSGIKDLDEIEKEISKTFYNNEDNKIFESMHRIKEEVNKPNVTQYPEVKHKDIFDPKAVAFLTSANAQKYIEKYINEYEKLIDESTYFKKGIFNHSQAEETASSLAKNGFFKADHAVLFGENKISTEGELIAIIAGEKEKILGSEALRETFDKLDKGIIKNQNLKNLREFLINNKFIISELANLESFKSKLWKYYLNVEIDEFNALIEKYDKAEERIQEITKQAQMERTGWLDVIEIFNERFIVPFSIVVSNKVDVVLKEDIPSISFQFSEGEDKKNVTQQKLLETLSQGEKRALYLLNILFEVEARKRTGGENIFIIDDIADSFDYKNKYAIIEYLRDMSKVSGFYQILLSHNFDFHRTVSNRLSLKREKKLNILKTKKCIEVKKEEYQNNPFNHWRKNLDKDCYLVAAIPFIRNLAEYSGDDRVYAELTKFLHVREEISQLKVSQLKILFSEIIKNSTLVNKIVDNNGRHYGELIESALQDSSEELESKIVKSIAIRLKTEQFIINNIDENNFVFNIKKNQTAVLIDKYKEIFPDEKKVIKTLDKVQLMTPESIHLNSFMYEPLLDMSNEYLNNLYDEICDY